MLGRFKVKSRIVGDAPEPKRRGRPPKQDRGVDSGAGSGGSGGEAIDPAAIGGDDSAAVVAEGTEQKRRGRKPGQKTRKNEKLDLTETLKTSLIFAHIGLAIGTRTPELALSEEQAKAMAVATADVLQYYDTQIPAKTMAWVNLAMCCGGIYFEKTTAVVERKRAEKARPVNAPMGIAA